MKTVAQFSWTLVERVMPVFPCFRVVSLTGVEVAKDVKKPEPVLLGEEDPSEDQNDSSPLLN